MTAQIAETLRLDGQSMPLMSTPLDDFFAMGGAKPAFEPSSTALWRGYVGTWEIAQDRLYLVALAGTLTSGEPVRLDTVFPGFAQRVFAHWYTGHLRVARGKLLRYVHSGFGSRYEFDLVIRVEQGVVQARKLHYNGPLPEGLSPAQQAAARWLTPRLGCAA